MARIRPYESQVSSQGDLPAQRAGEGNFGGPGLIRVGQAVEDLGASAGQVQRFMLEQKQRQEVTDTAVEHAQLQTDLAGKLDEMGRSWKPGDPPVSETFTGILKNQLDGLNGGDEGSRFETAGGADASRRHGAQTTQHFMALTRDLDAKLAGDAAATQHKAFVGAQSNFLQGHPANFTLERDRLAEMVNDRYGIYGRLPSGVKAKMIAEGTEELAVSAVQGFIRKSPNRALETLNDPNLAQSEQYGWMTQHIPNEQMQGLIAHAQAMVHAQELEQRQMDAELRRQHTETQEATAGKLTGKFLLNKGNPGNPNFPPLSPTEVGQLAYKGNLKDGDARALWGLIDDSTSGQHPPKTNWDAYWKLSNQIHGLNGETPLTSRTPILEKGGIARQLAPTDMERLLKQYDDTKNPQGQRLVKKQAEFMASMKPSIDTSILGKKLDSRGRELYGEFEALVQDKVEEYKEQGKSPWPLFDKNSQEYLGLVAQQPPYQRSLQEQIGEFSKKLQGQPGITKQSDSNVGGVPSSKQRLPGETTEQYDKRMGR